MNEALHQLDLLIGRLERSATVAPQQLWDRGTRLCHLARVRTGRASGSYPPRTVVPAGDPEGRESEGERAADRLSTDPARGPWQEDD